MHQSECIPLLIEVSRCGFLLLTAVTVELVEEVVEGLQTDEHQEGGGDGHLVHAASAGQADGSYHPDTGSSGEAADYVLTLAEDDGTGTYETDAGDYLGSHARHVETMARQGYGLLESVGRDHHEQGRAEGHEEMGAESGFLGTVLALQTDGTAQQGSDENA